MMTSDLTPIPETQGIWQSAGKWTQRCQAPEFISETRPWTEIFMLSAKTVGIPEVDGLKIMQAILQTLAQIVKRCRDEQQDPIIRVELFYPQIETTVNPASGWGYFLVEHMQYDASAASKMTSYLIKAYAYRETPPSEKLK